jgi:hypothetical protein
MGIRSCNSVPSSLLPSQGVPTYLEYLRDHLTPGSQVGYDASLHSAQTIQHLSHFISPKKITLVPGDINLIDLIWDTERPSLPFSDQSIRFHPLEFAQLTPTEKLHLLHEQYFQSSSGEGWISGKQKVLITTSLDEIAWLYNIRGDDVRCNPTLLAFSIIREGEPQSTTLLALISHLLASFSDGCTLYLNLDKTSSLPSESYFQTHCISIRPYHEFLSDLKQLIQTEASQFLIDPVTTNDAIWR